METGCSFFRLPLHRKFQYPDSVPLCVVTLSLLVPLLGLLAPDRVLSLHPVLIFRSPLVTTLPELFSKVVHFDCQLDTT